jgi:hypothetical protein
VIEKVWRDFFFGSVLFVIGPLFVSIKIKIETFIIVCIFCCVQLSQLIYKNNYFKQETLQYIFFFILRCQIIVKQA